MLECECRILCGSPVVDNGIYRHGDAVPAENFLKRNIHDSLTSISGELKKKIEKEFREFSEA